MNIGESSRKTLIALGSNEDSVWGDAKATILRATKIVQKLAVGSLKQSSLYATPAFPAGSGPDYVNAAIFFETTRSPAEILANLHEIEAQAGRVRTTRWGQRTLDLDLIAVGDQVLPDRETQLHWRNLPLDQQVKTAPAELILPHPRLQDRAFVLIPLCDVAPDWIDPVSGQSVAEMCAALQPDDRAEIRPIRPA